MSRSRQSQEDSFEKPDYEDHSRASRSAFTQSTIAPALKTGPVRDPRFIVGEPEEEDFEDEDHR